MRYLELDDNDAVALAEFVTNIVREAERHAGAAERSLADDLDALDAARRLADIYDAGAPCLHVVLARWSDPVPGCHVHGPYLSDGAAVADIPRLRREYYADIPSGVEVKTEELFR